MVMTLDLRLKGSRFDFRPFRFQVTTLGKLFAHNVPLTKHYWYSGQRAMMPYDWEGNRRSGVALVMRHRLQRFINLRAQWLTRGR